MPLATMFVRICPGASKPKMPCIMFESALIGAQFVSPNTRKPTSISGRESKIARKVVERLMPRLIFCTIMRASAITTEPIMTHFIGNASELIAA